MKRLGWLILLVLVVSACSQEESIPNLPEGDEARGATLFSQSIDGTERVGPTLEGYGAVASTRSIERTAQEYTHLSIVQPGTYLVKGFSNGMYSQYGKRLTPEQIADLIAYLLTL